MLGRPGKKEEISRDLVDNRLSVESSSEKKRKRTAETIEVEQGRSR